MLSIFTDIDSILGTEGPARSAGGSDRTEYRKAPGL
jgi:hypothetical protein